MVTNTYGGNINMYYEQLANNEERDLLEPGWRDSQRNTLLDVKAKREREKADSIKK
jgi:hypothetical protein